MYMRSIAVAVLAAGMALAGPVGGQELPKVPDINAEDVTVGQIVSFVNAMIAVERVRKDYEARIDEAETEDELNQLLAEADTAAMAAVDEVVGISPGEYVAIVKAAQEDEDLKARISARIEELREKQQPRLVVPVDE